MKIETAIVMLKNRAEQAIKRSTTYKEQTAAGDLLQITNTIIEYYNETEQQKKRELNAIKLARLFAECLDIGPLDWQKIPLLNADVFRKVLEDAAINSVFVKPAHILHDAFTQYDILTYLKNSIKQYDELLKQVQSEELKEQIILLKNNTLDYLDDLKNKYKL